jgi:hypothetical protein
MARRSGWPAMTAATPASCAWLLLIRPTSRRVPCGEPCEPGQPYCPKHQAMAWPPDGLNAMPGSPSTAKPSTALYGPRIALTGDHKGIAT